jgi:hypothetical protein
MTDLNAWRTTNCLLLAGANLLFAWGQASAQSPCAAAELTSGLQRPTAITQSNHGNLVVSESGTSAPNTGRISIVDLGGNRRTLLDGLPSGTSFEVNQPSGPAGVIMRGRTVYAAIGVGDAVQAGPLVGTTLPNPNRSSPIFSSVLAIHFSAHVEETTAGFALTLADHEALALGEPVQLSNAHGDNIRIELVADFPDYTPNPLPFLSANVRNTNPFSLVAVGDQLYVTDGGQNLVWDVDLPTRTFSVLTTFAGVPNPFFNPTPPPPSLGGPFLEAVPTGIAYSDGQLLVTLFRGFPFPVGASAVEQVDPLTGTHASFITMLTTAVDILPMRRQEDTSYLVLQHASGPVLSGPGRLLQFQVNRPSRVLESCLDHPTSMTLDAKTGTLYVTEIAAGRIVAIPGVSPHGMRRHPGL